MRIDYRGTFSLIILIVALSNLSMVTLMFRLFYIFIFALFYSDCFLMVCLYRSILLLWRRVGVGNKRLEVRTIGSHSVLGAREISKVAIQLTTL